MSGARGSAFDKTDIVNDNIVTDRFTVDLTEQDVNDCFSKFVKGLLYVRKRRIDAVYCIYPVVSDDHDIFRDGFPAAEKTFQGVDYNCIC